MTGPRTGLVVDDLTIRVRRRSGATTRLVEGVSFSLPPGGSLGLVGESGSGKTMTSLAIVGLLPRAASVESGHVYLDGTDLLALSEAQRRRLRGRRISMILQDPMTALDPCYTIRNQLGEPLRQHRGLSGRAMEEAMVEALAQVQLPAVKRRLRQYPHQLSGGMRQRVTSAIALAGRPDVLIADEPTTALDVTTQARYLHLLRGLQRANGFGLILVAHDLLVVKHVCSQVVVMYSGQVVEQGDVDDVFDRPQHPYTQALVNAIPTMNGTVQLESIEGQAPDPAARPDGCAFAPRCKHAREVCTTTAPSLTDRSGGRAARCWGTEPGGWVQS